LRGSMYPPANSAETLLATAVAPHRVAEDVLANSAGPVAEGTGPGQVGPSLI